MQVVVRLVVVRLVLLCLVAVGLSACAARPADRTVALAITLGSPAVSGELLVPGGVVDPPAVVMMSGAGPNDMDETTAAVRPLRDIAYGLAAQGIASIRYDKPTRNGAPSPAFTPTDEYGSYAAAALAVLDKSERVDPTRVFLLGHSFGGTMAPRLATAQPRFAGVILMAALAGDLPGALLRHFSHLANLGGELGTNARGQIGPAHDLIREVNGPALRAQQRMQSALAHEVVASGLTGRYFLDLRGYDATAAAAALDRPILVLQGERDYLVTVADDLERWTTALAGRDDVTLRRYPRANHTMIDGQGHPTPQEYEIPGHVNAQVINDIAHWVKAV